MPQQHPETYPHHVGCDVAFDTSGEDVPYFAETVYTPRETDPAESLALLDAMPYPEDREVAEFRRVLLPALALLVFFALGLTVGRLA